jgi:CRP/FNR family transcriptional regulator/CRP/FNR family cyclic AMP-dependent transcriptional regulator
MFHALPTAQFSRAATLNTPVTASNSVQKPAFLWQSDLMAELGDEMLARLQSAATERIVEPGDYVLLEEDPAGTGFFLVMDGEVKVSLTDDQGRDVVLATLGEGEGFGEMSILEGAPCSANVVALQQTRLLLLRDEPFKRFLAENPDFALALLTTLSRRLRRSNRQVEALALKDASGRVATALRQLGEERGIRTRESDGSVWVDIRCKPTQQHIAEMAGTTRETASRLIAKWEREGWVKNRGKVLRFVEKTLMRRIG